MGWRRDAKGEDMNTLKLIGRCVWAGLAGCGVRLICGLLAGLTIGDLTFSIFIGVSAGIAMALYTYRHPGNWLLDVLAAWP